MAEHLTEMAKSLVRVKDGKIEVLTDPLIRHCPLRNDLYGCVKESRETVRRVLEGHMKDMGMYGPCRTLEMDQRPVSFGASEIIMDGMAEGLIDAAVAVCEGAGTVVITRQEVLQAVGAHMTGLVSTEPIRETQRGLEQRGCLLLDEKCTIDQVKGYVKALDAGFRKIAVTIAGPKAMEAMKLREMGEASKARPIIFSVHNTGIDESSAEILAQYADIVWACASKAVRDIAGRRSLIQIGISIPVFGITQMGKRLILNRAQHYEGSLVLHRSSLPYAPGGKQPEPLI